MIYVSGYCLHFTFVFFVMEWLTLQLMYESMFAEGLGLGTSLFTLQAKWSLSTKPCKVCNAGWIRSEQRMEGAGLLGIA